ncbi:MAG: hypothetical protein EOM25_03175 [Deltaproteobacteria bacterium]|nr:hypothetical protein [Deltaproteobacteria bacterium]
MSSKTRILALVTVAAVVFVVGTVIYRLILLKNPPPPVYVPPPPAIEQPVLTPEDEPGPEPRSDIKPAPLEPIETEPAEPEAQPVEPEPAMPESDPVVTPEFPADLAVFLAGHYRPSGSVLNPESTGLLALDVKTVNMRYGTELLGLDPGPADDLDQARNSVFRHVLSPATIRVLSFLYAGQFVEELRLAATEITVEFPADGNATVRRALTPDQRREFFVLLSDKIKDVGQALVSLTGNRKVMDLTRDYVRRVDEVNNAYFYFWKFKDQGTPQDLEDAGKEIKNAILAREQARQNLKQAVLEGVRINTLNGNELLYMAQWTYRRLAADPSLADALNSMGRALIDLSSRLDRETP